MQFCCIKGTEDRDWELRKLVVSSSRLISKYIKLMQFTGQRCSILRWNFMLAWLLWIYFHFFFHMVPQTIYCLSRSAYAVYIILSQIPPQTIGGILEHSIMVFDTIINLRVAIFFPTCIYEPVPHQLIEEPWGEENLNVSRFAGYGSCT